MELTDDEIKRFAEACGDPRNEAAKQVMVAAGANSATGVLARLVVMDEADRQRMIKMIRRALAR